MSGDNKTVAVLCLALVASIGICWWGSNWRMARQAETEELKLMAASGYCQTLNNSQAGYGYHWEKFK